MDALFFTLADPDAGYREPLWACRWYGRIVDDQSESLGSALAERCGSGPAGGVWVEPADIATLLWMRAHRYMRDHFKYEERDLTYHEWSVLRRREARGCELDSKAIR